MRIMLDTNVLLSALLFPSKRMDQLIISVAVKNTFDFLEILTPTEYLNKYEAL